MTGKIGAKGQVVIPKPIRDLARLQPGDEVDFELRDGAVSISRADGVAEHLGGSLPGLSEDALLEDRRREPR